MLATFLRDGKTKKKSRVSCPEDPPGILKLIVKEGKFNMPPSVLNKSAFSLC